MAENHRSDKTVYVLEWDPIKEDVFVWRFKTLANQKDIVKTFELRPCGKNVYMCHHDYFADLLDSYPNILKE